MYVDIFCHAITHCEPLYEKVSNDSNLIGEQHVVTVVIVTLTGLSTHGAGQGQSSTTERKLQFSSLF